MLAFESHSQGPAYHIEVDEMTSQQGSKFASDRSQGIGEIDVFGFCWTPQTTMSCQMIFDQVNWRDIAIAN
jgi:hypothetical protein